MSLKLISAFAACLPIMLAACGGGGGAGSTSARVSSPLQVCLLGITGE